MGVGGEDGSDYLEFTWDPTHTYRGIRLIGWCWSAPSKIRENDSGKI